MGLNGLLLQREGVWECSVQEQWGKEETQEPAVGGETLVRQISVREGAAAADLVNSLVLTSQRIDSSKLYVPETPRKLAYLPTEPEPF